jgi:hypothetical protein
VAIVAPLVPRVETAHRVQLDAPAPLRLWHLTSLDAPTVAVTWTLAFAWSAHVRIPLWLPVVLGLAAWSFYIADRLFDARNAHTPLRARHHFHWQHRLVFTSVGIAAAVIAVTLALDFMPLVARARDSVLAAAALAYFGSVHIPWRPPISKSRLRIPKEFLVAVIFTLACTIPTWVIPPLNQPTLLESTLVFIALAWLNCHAIETWESQSNSSHRPSTVQLAIALTAVALLCAFIAAALHQPRQAALFASATLSAALLALLDRHQYSLTPIALRCAADLVLLAPILLLVIH